MVFLVAAKRLDDGTWFGEIPGFEGVWANGPTVESCRKELVEVLEEWLILKLRDGDPMPVVGGVEIKVSLVKEILRQARISEAEWEEAGS